MLNIKRTYSPGNFALRLDSGEAVFVHAPAGGKVVAEVTRDKGGPQGYFKKHISAIHHEDLLLQIRPFASQPLLDWIAASWSTNPPKVNCTLLSLDFKLNVQMERHLTGVHIAETTFPPLDGASKEHGYLTLRLASESITEQNGQGKLNLPALAKPKVWLGSHFRLEIGGLDTGKVQRIESFAVRAAGYPPKKVDFPDLWVALSAPLEPTWAGWYEDFVLRGNNDDSHEKSGALIFLAPDLQTELARIELRNLGIFSLKSEPGVAPGAIGGTTAGLYCENMKILPGGAIS